MRGLELITLLALAFVFYIGWRIGIKKWKDK